MLLKIKVTIIIIYVILLLCTCVFFVPYYIVWGAEETVTGATYAPIWKMIDNKADINGFVAVYKLDIYSTSLQIIVYTLLLNYILKTIQYFDK